MIELENDYGMKCPRCTSSNRIDVAATVWVRLCLNGTDIFEAANGDQEWTDNSAGTSGFRSMPKQRMASGRQSSRLSAATMNPMSCEMKPQSARRALKISLPWWGCMLSAAKSRQQNSSTSKAAAGIAVFRRFQLLFSTSSWDSCG
jgi:hypothetical protein